MLVPLMLHGLLDARAVPPDSDADGHAPPADCDDTDATVYPGAPEFVGDGVDNNCDDIELCYADDDADEHGELPLVYLYDPYGAFDCIAAGHAIELDDQCPGADDRIDLDGDQVPDCLSATSGSTTAASPGGSGWATTTPPGPTCGSGSVTGTTTGGSGPDTGQPPATAPDPTVGSDHRSSRRAGAGSCATGPLTPLANPALGQHSNSPGLWAWVVALAIRTARRRTAPATARATRPRG